MSLHGQVRDELEELETHHNNHTDNYFLFYLSLAVKLLVKFFKKALANIFPRQMDFCGGRTAEDDEKLHTRHFPVERN